MVFSILFFPPIIKIEVRRWERRENPEDTHERVLALLKQIEVTRGLNKTSPPWAVIRRAHADERGSRALNPTRWRCDAACPRNKFAVGVIFVERRDQNSLFAEYGGIDYRQYCVVPPLSPSFPPPSRLNNGSFVWRSIIIPASTLLSATRVRLVEADLSLEAGQLRNRLKKDTNRERRRWFFNGPAIGRQRWGHLPSLEK